MRPPNEIAEISAQKFLRAREHPSLLRFITCGSVDDGKSTLIGRLLYESKQLFDDQLDSLASDSRRYGTTGADKLDFALLVDGLIAEREQGITIDVAYRYFATERRNFIVADTPGHEQFTRNMVTGASTAELAVLLVDARKGVLTQTSRHCHLVALLGIRHVVLAINKMDLVGWSQATFDQLERDLRTLAGRLGIADVVCIPICAVAGDNIAQPSERMPWYRGPTLLAHLESVQVDNDESERPFRLPVQWVNRPHSDFRGYSGTIVGGRIRPGDQVVALPSAKRSSIARIVTMDGDLDSAQSGQAVTLVLTEEIEISRGDVVVSPDSRPIVSDRFVAHVVWMSEQPLVPGHSYLLRIGTSTVPARIADIRHRVNVNTFENEPATRMALNDIAACTLVLDRPVPFDHYADNRDMGSFILVDRISNGTVGCGMIAAEWHDQANLHWQPLKVHKAARAGLCGQKPCVLWFTGLSGAGKSTVADLVEQALHRGGKHTILLDGDNVRLGLNRDLGFADADRAENVRRVAEVAALMVDAGLICLVSFISPFRAERELARGLVEDGEFLELFVDAPLEVCEQRDPKALYRKARAGGLPGFTGIDSPYERPLAPELRLDAGSGTPEVLADSVMALLERRGLV